jgi:hypothetical protein
MSTSVDREKSITFESVWKLREPAQFVATDTVRNMIGIRVERDSRIEVLGTIHLTSGTSLIYFFTCAVYASQEYKPAPTACCFTCELSRVESVHLGPGSRSTSWSLRRTAQAREHHQTPTYATTGHHHARPASITHLAIRRYPTALCPMAFRSRRLPVRQIFPIHIRLHGRGASARYEGAREAFG